MDGPLRGELAITAAFESLASVLATVACRLGVDHLGPLPPRRRRPAVNTTTAARSRAA
ncbi:MAG: hypothetical protein JO086_11395 [Acidimicrobiia bacterium]|nr:hypothetical protein [Acidimicrobiia bacterium]